MRRLRRDGRSLSGRNGIAGIIRSRQHRPRPKNLDKALGGWQLFFSIGSQLSSHLFSTTNVITGGIAGVLLGLGGTLSQALFHRTLPWLGATAGSLGLAVGMLLIVLATAEDSSTTFLLGAITAGLGFGLAFLGGLRQLVVVIPHEHRAAVMSAFYIVAYASLALPAVVAGAVVTPLGLETTFETFGSIVAVIALIVAAEAWRTRPASAPA